MISALQGKMKTVVLYSSKDVRIEQREIPDVKTGEVLVRIKAVGICGSDLEYFKNGRIGKFIVEEPLILGHESAGDVVKIASDVCDLKVGDRVALEPGVGCGECIYCKTGKYNICPNVKFMATPPIDGSFAEYVAFPAKNVFKIPDNMSYEEAALMEPLSVALNATKRGNIRPGDKVIILGVGTIGLLVTQMSKVRGATEIVVSDVIKSRLSVARQLGATTAIDVNNKNIEKEINKLFSGLRADVAFEACGAAATVQQAIRVVKPGGKVVLIGLANIEHIPIDTTEVIFNELSIKGSMRYANTYPRGIDLVSKGYVNVKSLITHKFSLDETGEALNFVDTHKNEVIKAVIEV